MKRGYRIEWMHNGQWKMEGDDSLTFSSKSEAEVRLKKLQEEKKMPKVTRIVEVK